MIEERREHGAELGTVSAEQFERIFRIAQRSALARGLSPDDASDTAADTALAMLQRLGDDEFAHLSDEPSRLDAYVRATARNKAVDLIRRDSRMRAREERMASDRSVEIDDSPSQNDDLATRMLVRQAVDELPETHRWIVQLVYRDGLSTREAASALGISHQAARVRLHRAVKALRAVILAGDGAEIK